MDSELTLFSKQGSERDRLLRFDQAGGPGVTAIWQRTHSENSKTGYHHLCVDQTYFKRACFKVEEDLGPQKYRKTEEFVITCPGWKQILPYNTSVDQCLTWACWCYYVCVYLSAAAGLSLLCTELGPQVLPFFLIPFFTSSNSSGLKRELRPHVRLLSSWVTVNEENNLKIICKKSDLYWTN